MNLYIQVVATKDRCTFFHDTWKGERSNGNQKESCKEKGHEEKALGNSALW
jgi:hypothetical protein